MEIRPASIGDLSTNFVGNYIEKNSFLLYFDYGIDKNSWISYHIYDLRNLVQKGGIVLLALENNNVQGIVAAVKSDWDSKHFGAEIWNITHLGALGDYYQKRHLLKLLLSQLAENSNFELLITRSHTEDTGLIHTLEDMNFQLMDTLVTYYLEFKKWQDDFKETCRVEPLKDEMAQLKKIARISFSQTRVATDHFHADHRLDNAKSDALYENWVEQASKDKNSIVLVATIENKVVGFTTCKVNQAVNIYFNKKIGSLVLSAVSPEYRHAQIYTSMIHAGLRWLSDKVDIADLGTHLGNYAVQRAWSKLGFRIVRSQHTWHKWTDR